jgi:PAS domain S-box
MGRQQRRKETGSTGDALRQREALLDAIVRRSPIPQFVIDSNHLIVHWNEALEKYSGIKAEEVTGTNQQWRAFYLHKRPCMADLLVDEMIDLISRWYPGKYAKSVLVEGAYEATDFFPHMGPSGIWLYFTAAQIRDKDGRIIGALETLEDITKRKNAEAEVTESEQRLHAVFNAARDGMIVMDPDTHGFVMVNTAITKQTRYPEAELLTLTMSDLIRPADLPLSMEQFQKQLRGEISISTDMPILCKDGTIFFADINSSVVTMQGRQYLLGIFRDVAERRQAEEALRESEEKFRDIFNNTNDSIQIVALDRNGYPGRFIDVNDTACRMLQYSRDELLQKGPSDLEPSEPEAEFPGKSKDMIASEIETLGSSTFETVHIRKDGRHIPVEVSVHPVMLQGKHVSITVVRDITERKQAEKVLAESEERFRGVAERSSDLIVLMDMAWNAAYVSPSVMKILGYSPEEVTGMPAIEFVLPKDRNNVVSLQEKIHEGYSSEAEVRVLKKDGGYATIEMVVSPVIKDGKVSGAQLTGRDITERKRNEIERKKAIYQTGRNMEQLAVLNDQIRNPLAAILGYASLEEGPVFEKIIRLCNEIDHIITRLDMGFLESEKVRDFLKKHYDISTDENG